MKLRVTASTIKSWFQYRCERKIIYESLPASERQVIPIAELNNDVWAEIGNEFEDRLVAKLKQHHPGKVLSPNPGFDHLSEAATLAFLQGRTGNCYAHQALLAPTSATHEALGLPPDIELSRNKPDLIRREDGPDGPVFTLIDVKATQQATPFHKTQVAYYAFLLRQLLRQQGIPGRIAPDGEVWRFPEDGDTSGQYWQVEPFALGGYESVVIEFLRRDLPEMAQRQVRPGFDNTFFHVYFKCEQCKFAQHCVKAMGPEIPKADWDVSAVPGVSHGIKRSLLRQGIMSVGALADTQRIAKDPSTATWALKTKGPELFGRALALLDGAIRRIPDRYSWLMPARVEVSIHLLVDHYPVDGHLAGLGFKIVSPDGQRVHTVPIGSPEDELPAIKQILTEVIRTLTEVDRKNRSGETRHVAHLYVYEPSEAKDLQAALGRHLDDNDIRTGLLDMVRMFPPEETLPEPEYGGIQHLPATALRNVMQQLYLLPVEVAYDLRRVTQALELVEPSIGTAYHPTEDFERLFSSRLGINIGYRLRKGDIDPSDVAADMHQRLDALDALRRWLMDENSRSAEPFLRLEKEPFAFQAQFHPMNAADLDILRAQELLHNRASRLACLTELSLPADQRRDRFRCLANLTFVRPNRRGKLVELFFAVPPESRQAELSSSSFSLILTDDHPSRRLNPARWSSLKIRLTSDLAHGNGDMVVAVMSKGHFESVEFQALLNSTGPGGWFIDEFHEDFNIAKISNYLEFLAEAAL
jgi:hypothetical protein